MPRNRSAAWRHLHGLEPGDSVPAELYVLDYRDGERPRWVVHSVEELITGGRMLVLIDESQPYAADLFGRTELPVAVRVIAHRNKTLRTRPYVLGGAAGPTLCDLDQQGRHTAKARAQ